VKRSRAKPKHRLGDNQLDSPKALRDQARRLQDRIAAKEARIKSMQADVDKLRRQMTAHQNAAEMIEAADVDGRPEGEHQGLPPVREHVLRERSHGANVNRMLGPEHSLAISKGKTKDGAEADALVRAAHAKGLTLRGLARAIEKKVRRNVPVSRLSMARKGDRPIDRDIAEAIQVLTGFEAISKNWKGGISD
jgi:hypothetical protein